jgi:hypothetical protein
MVTMNDTTLHSAGILVETTSLAPGLSSEVSTTPPARDPKEKETIQVKEAATYPMQEAKKDEHATDEEKMEIVSKVVEPIVEEMIESVDESSKAQNIEATAFDVVEKEMPTAEPISEPESKDEMTNESVVERDEPFLILEEKNLLLTIIASLPRMASSPFMEPVDHEGLGLNDYLDICPNPMNLNAIKSNLEKEGITLGSVLADFSLVVENARTYSPRPHPIHTAACNLYKAWVDKLSKSEFKDAEIPPLISAKRASRPVCQVFISSF